MSLLNNSNKGKGKKKGSQPNSKPGSSNSFIPKGNSASKGAKSSRVASRSQRGS